MSCIGMIWAQTPAGIIGADGGLPWHLPEDLAHFAAVTRGHPVVMGRRTWESLPDAYRPLPGRRNIVLTRSRDGFDGAETAASLDEALTLCADAGEVWVIGGAGVFAAAMPVADVLEVTEIDLDVPGDTHAPEIDDTWMTVHADPAEGWRRAASGVGYRFTRWERRPIR